MTTTTRKRSRVDPATTELSYTPAQIEFMKAMDRYKREAKRPFPAWSEALDVLDALGYRKVAAPRDFMETRTDKIKRIVLTLLPSEPPGITSLELTAAWPDADVPHHTTMSKQLKDGVERGDWFVTTGNNKYVAYRFYKASSA